MLNKLILNRISVLEFIDQISVEFSMPSLPYLRIIIQNFCCIHQKIIKIQ